MNPTFDVRFSIGETGKIVLTDTSDYSGVSDYYGFFKVKYPDGVVVENKDPENPDVDGTKAVLEIPLRKRTGFIQGEYVVSLKIFADSEEFISEKVFDFSFAVPSLIMKDSSAIPVPSVSFMDATDYALEGYNHGVTRFIECDFPDTANISGTVTTVAIEIFMANNGNAYEGIYRPRLTSTVLYTATDHSIEWTGEKEFVFDIRGFIGFDNIVQLLNQVKERLNEGDDIRRDYFMVTSLYSHITAKLGVGEFDVADLVAEMQEIAYRLSCACCGDSYGYSPLPLPPYDPSDFIGGFPFIDQVIYREWNENIVFRQTSTIFYRDEGRIKWYKSKVNGNVGNPIFIDGELNEDFWEPINDCCEYQTWRQEFVYGGGPQQFVLDYTPSNVLLVSANGYGPYFSNDYSVSGNVVTILPPNVLSVGSEIVVIATYGGDDITNVPGGFNKVLDSDGAEQFNSVNNQNLTFEGKGDIRIIFGEDNRVSIGNSIAPVYVSPTASLTNNNQTREVGEEINLSFSIGFVQNDAGAATGYSLFRSDNNGAWINETNDQISDLEDVEVILGSMRYRGTVYHSEGPTKNDNLGEPYPDGKIMAGSVNSNISTIMGRYRFFFGNSGSVPSNSAEVRALPQSEFDNESPIDLETGTTNTIFPVAIPSDKTIESVRDITNLNADLTNEYVLDGLIMVNDAGGNPIEYKLYVYQTAISYTQSATHRILIS